MWRQQALLRQALLRAMASQSHASAIGGLGAIPVELAELVSLRGSGMVRVPAAVQAGLQAAAAGKRHCVWLHSCYQYPPSLWLQDACLHPAAPIFTAPPPPQTSVARR